MLDNLYLFSQTVPVEECDRADIDDAMPIRIMQQGRGGPGKKAGESASNFLKSAAQGGTASTGGRMASGGFKALSQYATQLQTANNARLDKQQKRSNAAKKGAQTRKTQPNQKMMKDLVASKKTAV